MSVFALHAGDDCCDLITIGRRTGKLRQVEIWFGVIDDVLYLISGNGTGADWYRNACASNPATVVFGGVQVDCVVRPVTDADERRRVGELMGAKYPWEGDPSIGLTSDAWCFEVPALALEPR